MSHQEVLEKKKYRNWVRGRLAYKYLKEGIEGFADDAVNEEHRRISQDDLSARSCNQCSIRNLRPLHPCKKDHAGRNKCPWGQNGCNCLYTKKQRCPNKVCDVIMEDILKNHGSEPPSPNWKNTDVQKWCSTPWEIAKCYINAPGYFDKSKADDIDISGLLHVFINNISLKSHLSDKINSGDIFLKILQRRNELFHSPTMEMEDSKLDECIDEIIAILEDEKELKARRDAQEAVFKLKQLKRENFIITTHNEAEVCRDALTSITNKAEELKQTIKDANDDIVKKQAEATEAVGEVTSKVLRDALGYSDNQNETLYERVGRLESDHSVTKQRLTKLESRVDQLDIIRQNHQKQLDYVEGKQDSSGPELLIGSTVELMETFTCVGPFVRIQETGELCFLTSSFVGTDCIGAKVFLPALYDIGSGKTALGHEPKICGEVIAAEHKSIFAALIKIANECIPIRSKFRAFTDEDLARAGISNPNLPPFEIGNILDLSKSSIETLAKGRYFMLGSRLITGRLHLERVKARIGSFLVPEDLLLFDVDFDGSDLGGSAAYFLDNNNCLHCIGIVCGASGVGRLFVMPIQVVLEELGRKIGQTLEIAAFLDSKDINSTLDPHDAYIFSQALKRGTGKDKLVRVNVVGYYAQGKTRRLLNQSLEGVESTDFINIQKCKMKETEWEHFQTESDKHECLTRLAETAMAFHKDDHIEEQVEREITIVAETSCQTMQTVNQLEISEEQSETSTISDKPASSNAFSAFEKTSVSNVSTVAEIANTDIGKETSFIKNYSRELKDKSQMIFENYLSTNIWDFGGQFIYYATHQIFHSREAIYLLVFDLTKDLNEYCIDNDFPSRRKKMKNCLKFWLDSIHAFVGPDDDEENETQKSTRMQELRSGILAKSEPNVILVGTHKDKFDGNITEKFNEVINLFAGTKSIAHISQRRFAVSNTDFSDQEIEKLRKTIFLIGKERAERKQVPMKWIPLEIALLKEKKRNIITMEEVKRLNSENESLVEEAELKTFLKYLHLKGTVVYFDEKELDQHVVVNPQYLIDAFRCIIRPREFWVRNADLQPLWEDMHNTAVLKKELLDAVWNEEAGKDFKNNADVLLMFLQKHRILAELPVTDDKGNVEFQGRYMIPSLLKSCCDENNLNQFQGICPRTKVSLGLYAKSMQVLPNVYERVTAAALGKWSPVKFRGQIMVFQNVGVYELDDQHAGQVELTTRGIKLVVINQCQQEVESKVCDHFRRYVESVINNEFYKLKSRQKQRNTYTYYLFCNSHEHDGTGSINTHKMCEVEKKERVRCPDNCSHPMECKKGIEEWFPIGKVSDYCEIPKRRVTQQDLADIAGCLGNNWELLGSLLGIRDVEIQRLKMDCPGQAATCIYRMLLKWEQNEGENATLYRLIRSIEGCTSISVDNDGMKNVVDK